MKKAGLSSNPQTPRASRRAWIDLNGVTDEWVVAVRVAAKEVTAHAFTPKPCCTIRPRSVCACCCSCVAELVYRETARVVEHR